MNSRARVVAALTLILAVGVMLSGCGSSKPPIAITLGPSGTQNVVAGQVVNVTATVSNDSKAAGVTWSITGPGALSAQTTTSVTYTAPSPISANTTATITATSVSDATKTATLTINLQAVSVAVSPSSATVASGSAAPFTATVSNDPSNTSSVTWAVTCSLVQCGSVSPTTTPSGTATTYTAPSTPPTSALTVTITATSVFDTTKSNSATITVPPAAISVAPTTATVLAGNNTQFTATVTNTSNKAVTWTVTCPVASCGTLNSSTANPVTYTAPGPPPSNLTVTIKATSAADTTKTASATITVPAITVTVAPPSANVPVKGTANFTATVGNDAANKGVTWTLTQGGTACSPAVCGTITLSTASGAPATYTAPTTVPANPAVTITATSVSDLSKTATATATVVGITVSVSPTTASVVVNGTQQFTATVSNDVSSSGVTWTLRQGGVACAPTTCGSVSPTSGTGNSPMTTYTAPATVPATPTVTLTATSLADTTKFASATITITAAPPISVTISPTNPTVTTGGTKQFTATVTNDPAAKGVTWTLTQAGVACTAACGSVSPTSGTGNSPMTTYTAPATVPTPATVTITATSVADTTKSASTTITIAAAAACNSGTGHESVLNGQYAFLFQGFDANGPVTTAGTFSADGTGKVALLVGVEDINNSTSGQLITPTSINAVGSSYTVGLSNGGFRGCLNIATSSGTSTYALSLGSLSSNIATKGRMIEFDNTGTLGSGVLRLQDTTAFNNGAISGSYAFGASSTLSLSTTTRSRFAVAGSFTASGSGVISGGELDANSSGTVDGGTPGPLSIQSTSSYSVSSSTGRATFTFNIAGVPSPVHGIFYVVSASEALTMSADAQSVNSPFAGSVLKQSGSFTTSSLSGNSVFCAAGLCGGCGPGSTVAPNLSVGVINVTTAGQFTLTGDQNKGGTVSPQSFTGTYTVDSSGRVLITQTGSPAPGAVIYLVGSNQGFLVTAGGQVGAGFVEPQTGSSFNNGSVSGSFFFGTTEQTEQFVSDNSGVATFDGVGTVSGTSDNASLGSTPTPGQTFSQPYSVTNGTGTPGRGTITQSGAVNLIFYIISPSKAVLMGANAGNSNPSLTIGEK